LSNALLYVATVLIWGSTWIGIEFQLGVVNPMVSVFYRYAIAALLLIGWCRLRGKSLAFGGAAHLRFLLLGLTLFGINYLLTYHAQQWLTSALAAILFSTMLWLNMINARLFFGVRSGARVVAGSLIGVAGIVILFYPEVRYLSWSDATFFGAVLALLGAFVASLGNMISQNAQNRGLPVVQSNAWGMAYGALFTGLLALLRGHAFTFDASPGYVLSLLYLAVVGSILAFGAYLTLLGRIGAHRAGYAVVMFPVVAVVISVLFEDLRVTGNLIAGAGLVMLGNVFVLQTRRPPATTTAGALPVEEPTAAS
jgi:drug/metabolite transporter (DMT)-like permease